VIEKGKANIDPEYMARFKSSRVGGMMGKSDGTGVARKQLGPMAPTKAGTTEGVSGTAIGRNGLQPTRSELEG